MTSKHRRFATPTEQAHGVLGGPIGKGTPEETAACVRRVKLEARDSAEAVDILQMLGIVDVNFRWVAVSRNGRKKVPK
ncbi:hypothetical protein [Amycolatopsis jejuensis]|uniref:hypothetical protein n=1 Tax=Amycolatopsis jejuensis TaxID=330084 RepID=UPI000525160F|nr:hypothetical protein [Amycolatopsis jejuensis]